MECGPAAGEAGSQDISAPSHRLHNKMEAYRRNRVREYIVWRVLDSAIDRFHLEGDQYVPVQPDEAGLIESAQFPGLRLAVPHMLAGDLSAVLRQVGGQGSDQTP